MADAKSKRKSNPNVAMRARFAGRALAPVKLLDRSDAVLAEDMACNTLPTPKKKTRNL